MWVWATYLARVVTISKKTNLISVKVNGPRPPLELAGRGDWSTVAVPRRLLQKRPSATAEFNGPADMRLLAPDYPSSIADHIHFVIFQHDRGAELSRSNLLAFALLFIFVGRYGSQWIVL